MLGQGLSDGVGAEGTEVAVGQVAACLQDQILQRGFGAAGLVRGVRAIRPVDPIEALALGPPDPVGNRGDAGAELARDGAECLARTDSGYHGPTPVGSTLCLLIGLPRNGFVLGKYSPQLFGINWHNTVRDQLALVR